MKKLIKYFVDNEDSDVVLTHISCFPVNHPLPFFKQRGVQIKYLVPSLGLEGEAKFQGYSENEAAKNALKFIYRLKNL